MANYFLNALGSIESKKEAKSHKNLPFQRPNTKTNVGTNEQAAMVRASTPADPNAKNQLPDSALKRQLDFYESKDNDFGSFPMEDFTTAIMALKEDMGGLGLPEDVQRKRVEQILSGYQNQSAGQNFNKHRLEQNIRGSLSELGGLGNGNV